MMKLIEQLLLIGQTWTGVTATLLAILVLLIVRRFLPAEQHKRGTVSLFFLCFALIFGLSATVALKAGAYTVWGVLSFLDLLSLVCGLTGLVGLVVFDLVLSRLRVRVPSIVRDLIHISIVALIVLTILYERGLDPLSLVTTSAVLTAVIGLALQGTIANVFAGLALHTDRTLGIGDWVQAGHMIGRIAEIKWRSTSLWTEDGDLVIVPNSRLLDAEVQNLSRPDDVHRMWVKVGFHYRHPPNEVKRILLDAVRATPGVRAEPAADCVLLDFADSAITYALRYWISDFAHHTAIESEVRTRIWYAARRGGLEIPFPIRTLVMPTIAAAAAAIGQNNEVADHLTALAQSDLFAALNEEARATLAVGMRTIGFGAGEDILREGESGGSLYVMRSGEVMVYLTEDGARHEVATLKPGDFFGEMALMTGEQRPAGYAAKSDTVCAVIDHAALTHVLRAQPKIAEDLSAVLAARGLALDGEWKGRAAEPKSRLLAGIRRVFGATDSVNN